MADSENTEGNGSGETVNTETEEELAVRRQAAEDQRDADAQQRRLLMAGARRDDVVRASIAAAVGEFDANIGSGGLNGVAQSVGVFVQGDGNGNLSGAVTPGINDANMFSPVPALQPPAVTTASNVVVISQSSPTNVISQATPSVAPSQVTPTVFTGQQNQNLVTPAATTGQGATGSASVSQNNGGPNLTQGNTGGQQQTVWRNTPSDVFVGAKGADNKIYRVKVTHENDDQIVGVFATSNQTMVVDKSVLCDDPGYSLSGYKIPRVQVNRSFTRGTFFNRLKFVQNNNQPPSSSGGIPVNSQQTQPPPVATFQGSMASQLNTPQAPLQAPTMMSGGAAASAGNVMPNLSQQLNPGGQGGFSQENLDVLTKALSLSMSTIIADSRAANMNICDTFAKTLADQNATGVSALSDALKLSMETSDDNTKANSKVININDHLTPVAAFQDNMRSTLSPARFLPTGTDTALWQRMVPKTSEPIR